MMQIVTALVELLKHAIWPLFIGAVLIYYRVEIRDLLPRILKLGASGLEVSPPTAVDKQPEIGANKSVAAGELKNFRGISRSEAIKITEREILQNLEKTVSSGEISENEKVDYLARHLAETRLEAHYERVYNIIFGSQLKAIRTLNERKEVNILDMKKIYDDFSDRFPDLYETAKFEGWINFLKNSHLVMVDGQNLSLTEIGREFLIYITFRGLPVEKYG